MGAAKKLIDKKVLRDLVPINALSANHIDEISKKAFLEEVRSGTYVFKRGDRDYQTVYLLEGTVELLDENRELVATVTAGSEAARHPLAHKQPRQLGARAAGRVTVARVDSSLLDVLLTWDESAGYDVVEIDAQDDDDWMTRMLQSQAFLQLPPSNIHQLLMRLEAVSVSAGDVVVRQGDEGDYFYIVKSGRLAVTRKASPRSKEVLLAELGEGACFGEEALVSGTKRNASVMMATDGSLMRLSKNDFQELLCAPLVHESDFESAQKLAESGAKWLDVRLPGEFDNQAIRGSTNLPLSALRDQCAELDKDTDYIVCCDTGRRSAAGAFVLSQRGFSVYTLKNGLMDVPEEALVGKGDDKPAKAAQDADIIPFDSDNRPGSATAAAPADTALIDKLAAAENDKLALEQQFEQLQAQLRDAERRVQEAEVRRQEGQSDDAQRRQEVAALAEQLDERQQQARQQIDAMEQDKRALQAEVGALRDEITSNRQRLQAADVEKQSLQDELNRLQQTLSQIQQSVEGRDDALRQELEQMAGRLETEQQRYEKQAHDLEEELNRVREDYHQLGQRTSAVAGERDAAARELQVLQEQSNNGQAELQQVLAEREQALEAQQTESQRLKQQLEELENNRQQLEQQLTIAGEQSDAEKSQTGELQTRLQTLEQQNQALESTVQTANQQLEDVQTQLQQAEHQAQDQQAEAAGEKSALQQRTEELQQQLEQVRSEIGAERDALAESAAQAQQARETLNNETREMAEQLHQQAARTEERVTLLETELEQARQNKAALEQRNAELDERLASIAKEHETDVASTREALSRAQTETENVQREQSRLMASLRKAEQNLERERQDHEAEIHRLHKELKDAAGESNAGLAAEMEALQERLKEQTKDRDDLEIKLGERGAQLEDVRVEAEKLALQLHQAQDSARQAEQQLLESNQAANAEMAVRMEAEEKAQQALRDELTKVIGERNRSQEQLTVQLHELDELHVALETAQQETAAGEESAQAALATLQHKHDEALEQQHSLQQEVDQLRAEAEVTRGLVDMQATPGGVDAALREELEQAKKNVDVAVRLRTQAEDRNAALQAEIETLRAELQSSTRQPTGHIPSLDEDDPHAAGVLSTDYPELKDDEPQVAAVLIAEDSAPAGMSPVGASTGSGAPGAGGLKAGLFAGVLIGAVIVGVGMWWLSKQQQPEQPVPTSSTHQAPQPIRADKSEQAAAVPAPARAKPKQQEKPAKIPDFSKGGSGEAAVIASNPPHSAVTSPARATPVIPAQAGIQEAQSNRLDSGLRRNDGGLSVHNAGQAAPAKPQPLRSYSEPLADGGRAPTLVALPAAGFDMGSGASSAHFDERPRHRVQLRGFAISKHEVTFAEYDRFARATGRRRPSDAGWGRGQRPVINVRWQDALAYTQWLSEQTGSRYRLPSEAEWEFAMRAGNDTRFWWGNDVGDGKANCFDCGGRWSGLKTAPVGSFAASPFDVQDMAGNVMEWVQDCYQPDYTAAPADGGAVTTGDCGRRVVRGGGYGSPSENLRSASRDAREADTRLDNLGFRVVKE